MKILVIDDHPLFVEGISYLLKQSVPSVKIFKANNAEAAIEQLATGIDFDLALLDINMPGMDGLALLQRLSADELCLPVIIVSAEERAGLIQQALDLGALGFIPKSSSPAEMRSAIEQVLVGEPYLPKSIQALLARLPSQQPHTQHTLALQQSGLSNKQFEVLNLLAKGYSNEQIANTLNRTEHTVKSHIAALFQILGASSRIECVRIAQQRQLVENTQ